MDGIVVCSQLLLYAKTTAIKPLCNDRSGFKVGHPDLLPMNMGKFILSCYLKFTFTYILDLVSLKESLTEEKSSIVDLLLKALTQNKLAARKNRTLDLHTDDL